MDIAATTWFNANKEKFSPQQQIVIQKKIENLSAEDLAVLTAVQLRSPLAHFFITFFFGALGISWFMIGRSGRGLLSLLTFGGCGIIWLIDICTIMGEVRKHNYESILVYLH